MPCMRQFSFCFREIQDHTGAALLQRSSPQLFKFSRGLIIEIAMRHLGVAISFAGDEPANVSAILTEQRLWVILRMALQENGETPSLLQEHIRPDLRRSRDDAIALTDQLLF